MGREIVLASGAASRHDGCAMKHLRPLLFLALFAPTRAAEPPPAADERATILDECRTAIAKFTMRLEANPNSVTTYSDRGDAHLYAGNFKEARADFEKMIALDPAQDAPHWRLGIAYFFLGDYAKGARQFEKYHAYDDHDRENGVWHYFCLAKVEGIEKARAKMLAYTKFDRHPFPSVYEMLAGKKSAADVLKEIDQSDAGEDEKDRRRFFAELYIGFDDWLNGRTAAAVAHLEKAAANRWGRELSGRTYMWHVARLLRDEWSRLEKKP